MYKTEAVPALKEESLLPHRYTIILILMSSRTSQKLSHLTAPGKPGLLSRLQLQLHRNHNYSLLITFLVWIYGAVHAATLY